MRVGVVTVLFRPDPGGVSGKSVAAGYDETWVNNLHAQMRTHIRQPFRFFCLTDYLPTNFHDRVEPIPLQTEWRNWWTLNEVFRPDYGCERMVYAQLDTVICGPLDDIIDAPHPLMLAANRHLQVSAGFGVWDQSEVTPIWDEVVQEGEPLRVRMRHELRYWQNRFGHAKLFNRDVFPGRVLSYKREYRRNRYLTQDGFRPLNRSKASVVWFHGNPRPNRLPVGHFLRKAGGW